jgi:hypothetical protein
MAVLACIVGVGHGEGLALGIGRAEIAASLEIRLVGRYIAHTEPAMTVF